jgi:hypothetical protein
VNDGIFLLTKNHLSSIIYLDSERKVKDMRGLMAGVYKNGTRECTNGGVTANVDHVVIVSDEYDMPDIFEATEDMPALRLETRDVGLARFPVLVPVDCPKDGRQGPYMFGGNFVYTSDSRFPSDTPIKVFDRREW